MHQFDYNIAFVLIYCCCCFVFFCCVFFCLFVVVFFVCFFVRFFFFFFFCKFSYSKTIVGIINESGILTTSSVDVTLWPPSCSGKICGHKSTYIKCGDVLILAKTFYREAAIRRWLSKI